MRQHHIDAGDLAITRRGLTGKIARIALNLRAHLSDAIVTGDEDTAMAIRRITGGTGAPVRVEQSHLVPDPRPADSTMPAEELRRGRVMVLSPDNCTFGGIQRYTWTWGEAALDLGYSVRIAALWKRGTVQGEGVSRVRAAWFTFKTVITALVRRPDAVISAHLSLSPVALIIRRLTGAPYAVTLHGNEAWRGEFGKRAECAIRKADLRIPVSHFTRDVLAEMLGFEPQRFYVTGGLLAPELQLRAEKYRVTPSLEQMADVPCNEQAPRYLLTVARLDLNAPYKRHDLVLRAVAALASDYPELTYHIVGDGPYRTDLEALTAQLRIEDRVKFLGRISEEALAEENANAYAFVMPSRISLKPSEGEGFGFVYLEAGIYGVPSIAANGGGSTETVLDSITGLLVEPDSLESLIAGIRALLDDKALRDQLGEMAPLRAIEFSYPIFRRKCRAVLLALTEDQDPQSVEPEHDPRAIAQWILTGPGGVTGASA
ncbi:MAG: hypothetical protein DCC49_03495 [Acidobacteria bacterium]|nr:MAG: hypothetical protein DCC49_03495 [Acidobacteriota bacterium]